MKVLAIGAGNMGSGFVKQLSAAGHTVSVTARDVAKAAAVASQYANATAVPGAQVVKAFNTILAQVLGQGSSLVNDSKVTVFYAGDSDPVKGTAKKLAESLGIVTADAGGLKNARYLEPVAGLNIYFAYDAGRGTAIAPAWQGV